MINIASLFVLAAALLHRVNAVFQDEAFKVDWQFQNLGTYTAVSESQLDPTELIVLSQIEDGVSMLSTIDKKDGSVTSRKLLDTEYHDFMVNYKNNETEHVILKGYEDDMSVIDFTTGLYLTNYTFPVFESSALHRLNDRYALNSTYFNVLDESEGLIIMKNDLNMTSSELVFHYVKTDYASVVELLVSHFKTDLYYYFKFENSVLTNHWTKHELASNVVSFVEVNPRSDVADTSAEFVQEEKAVDNSPVSILNAYIHRLRFNFQRFKQSIIIEKKLSIGSMILDLFSENTSAEGISKRDERFGFTQYLIVAKQSGLITCFDIKDGSVQWTYKTDFKIRQLIKNSDSTVVSVFSEKDSMIELDISKITQTPILMSDKETKFFPEGQIKSIIPLSNDTLFMRDHDGEGFLSKKNVFDKDNVIVDHTTSKVYAYKPDITGYGLNKLWEYTPGQDIVSLAHKDQDDKIANIGIILGNRTVLYKYLYPHLFAVASVGENTLTIDILDAMTGNLVKSFVHASELVDVSKPINMVFGENWVVYSYFANTPIPEQRLNVIELYESLTPNERVSKGDEPQDVYGYIAEPAILTQSYFYPEIISNMALSKTKFGISSKSIILELANGQITFLPKYVVSARRKDVADMTKDDKKEFMASPYISTIPINDQMVITHERSILPSNGQSQLVSFPTNLESTSYVCSIGYDVFCTRISPSSQFDVLPNSFERAQIMITIILLVVGVYIVRPWVETKKLKLKWFVKG